MRDRYPTNISFPSYIRSNKNGIEKALEILGRIDELNMMMICFQCYRRYTGSDSNVICEHCKEIMS